MVEEWELTGVESSSMGTANKVINGVRDVYVYFAYQATFRQKHGVRGTYDVHRVDEWNVRVYLIMPPEFKWGPTQEDREQDTVRFDFQKAEMAASTRRWRAKPDTNHMWTVLEREMSAKDFHPKTLAGNNYFYRDVIPFHKHFDYNEND